MFELIVECRISEAVERGEFDNLPGQGRPLDLDDEDPLWPAEARMARRILKNAGFENLLLDEAERAGRQHALRCLSHIREVKL